MTTYLAMHFESNLYFWEKFLKINIFLLWGKISKINRLHAFKIDLYYWEKSQNVTFFILWRKNEKTLLVLNGKNHLY